MAPTDSSETRELMDQTSAGDPEAFERLFAHFRPYLRRVVGARLDSRLRARVDPSDVVQETQMEAFRRLPDYLRRRPMPFRLWLRKTAHERMLVLRRRHAGAECRSVKREAPLPEQSSLLLAQPFLANGPSPSQALDKGELARRVRAAVSRLSEADQELLLMRTFEGLSNQEVGCVLGVDPGTASKRYGRALVRLHHLLAAEGLTESQV